MTQYFIRLDDACPKRNIEKWDRMEILLDKYNINPLVGIIPNCKDTEMEKYSIDNNFWTKRIPSWKNKKWTLAMHGFEHVYVTKEGGINPVNKRSEFAGLPYQEQVKKISQGYTILKQYGINPQIFFAPAHTFDDNTLKALQDNTSIRIISDTIANDIYKQNNFYFIPQQSGRVRKLPFKLVTFCYHPNNMDDKAFIELEKFISKYRMNFVTFSSLLLKNRARTLWEKILQKCYLYKHKRRERCFFNEISGQK